MVFDELLTFDESDKFEAEQDNAKFKVIIVDDESEVHTITKIVLDNFVFEGRKLELLSAYSGREAKKLIAENPDVAVILLDVVMEDIDSGLEVVKYIRNELKNQLVRIILRTGQPGHAPEERVIIDYDINDYREKTELTNRKLYTSIISSLRAYRDLNIIEKNKAGLEKIIDSTATIHKIGSLKKLASTVLEQIADILHIGSDALYCNTSLNGSNRDFFIVAATGEYSQHINKNIKELLPAQVLNDVEKARVTRSSIFNEEYSIVYFAGNIGSENIIYFKSYNNLSESDKGLLEMFCRNISTAFENAYINSVFLDNLKDAIIIADNEDKVVKTNNSFKNIFKDFLNDEFYLGAFAEYIGQNARSSGNTDIISQFKDNSANATLGELNILKPEKKSFMVDILPIYGTDNKSVLKIISFSDVSLYKDLLEELDEKNHKLNSVIEQLKEYSRTVEELTITNERNRIAREIHDTLGHTMTLLSIFLESVKVDLRKNPQLVEDKLIEAAKISRSGLKELKRSIAGLSPENLESENLIFALNELVSDFQVSGIRVDLVIEGLKDYRHPKYSEAIYRLCQEAMTNAARHGNAKNITIVIKMVEELIKIVIIDDGSGCKFIKKGNGLLGMEKRVTELNGSISLNSNEETGFAIKVEIPLEEKND